MLVVNAVLEYEFATSHLAAESRRWNHGKLTDFAEWLAAQGITELEDVDVPIVRRFFDALRRRTSKQTGRPLSSYTLRGYFAIVRIFLNWCVREDLLPDRFGKRLVPPKLEQKIIRIFAPSEIAARATRSAKSAWAARRVCGCIASSRVIARLRRVSDACS